MLDRLLSVYSSKPDSNIAKLIAILAAELEKVKGAFEKIDEWRDIEKASGKTLDLIGSNVNQYRGATTDEIYRILIKSKIASNLSTGDINTIIEVLSIALDTDPSEIVVREEEEGASISIVKIPINRLNEVGMSGAQFGLLVKKVVAAGVKVQQVELSGTFSFASGNGTELDSEAGFSDLEGNVGGYFGQAFEPNQYELPI